MNDESPVTDWDALPPTDIPDDTPAADEGVVPLGHDHGNYFYLSRSARQVVALTAQQHSKPYFLSLASLPHYWARTQFVGERGKIDWDGVADHLMRQCRDIGIYDAERVRGRGAWFDDGRAVLHLGDRLIVDGVPLASLALGGSRHVYEAGLPMLRDLPPPLSHAEANRLVKICGALRWEKPIYGVLLAGFLALAPICGALAWRPSIWLTGKSGSGKTWVYENIISSLLRGVALFVQSKTSEAGIRQRLGSDARPVAFDEAESEDQASQQRIQAVLDLIRQSASETGAEIVKGTAGQHGARSYRVRSCFCLVSINVSIQHAADQSRISVLGLRDTESTPAAAAAFEALNTEVQTTLTPAFAAALIARSARLVPVIRRNAATFARAVALQLRSRRAGDQIGALLAGAYSLHSDQPISAAAAADFVARQPWDGAASDAEPDERRLLAHLTQHVLPVDWGNGGTTRATVGTLMEAAQGRDERLPADVAERALRQIGLRTDAGGLFVSNSHPALAALLRGTPWHAQWRLTLARLPGAEATGRPIRFGAAHKDRAIFVPASAIDPPD